MGSRSDTFNRTDSGIQVNPPTDGGSNWVLQTLGPEILTNKVRNNSGAGAHATLESSLSDVAVQCTFSTTLTTGGWGITFRVQDSLNFLYLNLDNTTDVSFRKRVAGTGTVLKTTTGLTIASGDVWKVTANGTSIEFFQNGTSRLTDTNSLYQTETKHGLRDGAGDNTMRWDDFTIDPAATAWGPLLGLTNNRLVVGT